MTYDSQEGLSERVQEVVSFDHQSIESVKAELESILELFEEDRFEEFGTEAARFIA